MGYLELLGKLWGFLEGCEGKSEIFEMIDLFLVKSHFWFRRIWENMVDRFSIFGFINTEFGRISETGVQKKHHTEIIFGKKLVKVWVCQIDFPIFKKIQFFRFSWIWPPGFFFRIFRVRYFIFYFAWVPRLLGRFWLCFQNICQKKEANSENRRF